MPSQGDVTTVEGGEAQLFTTEEGATMYMRTNGLEPGHVYTLWVVFFNNPDACAAENCGSTDLLENTDAVQGEVVYGDGIIAEDDGIAEFAAHLSVGMASLISRSKSSVRSR